MTSKHKVHRPLVAACLLFTTGICLQHFWSIPLVAMVVAGAGLLLTGFFVIHSPWSDVLVGIVLVLAGFLYTSVYQSLPKDHYANIARYYRGVYVVIEGEVVSDPEKKETAYGEKISYTLKVNRVLTRWGWKEKCGKLLVNAFGFDPPRFGDIVRIKGKLHPPFEYDSSAMSYRDYLKRRGIRYICSVGKEGEVTVIGSRRSFFSGFIETRRKLVDTLDAHLTPNESGVMKAVLLGVRTQIPKHIRELFVITGTAHILAISGLHIGMIAFIFFLITKFLPVGRRAQIFMTAICVVLYAFMVGGRPSVIRATIMTVVFLVSLAVEREGDGLNTLALAAFIILLMNPLSIFDIGFQLSFLSVLSIIVLSPVFQKLKRHFNFPLRIQRVVFDMLCVSFSAWVGVAGCIGYYFEVVTPINLLANLIVVPMMFALVALGFMLLAAGQIWLAGYFALTLKAVLGLMVVGVYILSLCPGASFYVRNLSVWHVTIYYIFLCCAVWVVRKWACD